MSQLLVNSCPECESSNLNERTATKPQYLCQDCRNEFDEPYRRRTRENNPKHGLARKIEQLDPEEIDL